MRIAIVDDIQDVRSRMAALIEEFANQHHLHYQLDSYASGEKLWKALKLIAMISYF